MDADSAASSTTLNIKRVVYGDLEFTPWYPSLGYFDPSQRPTKRNTENLPKCVLTDQGEFPKSVDRLYVCSGCFKYSVRLPDVSGHQGFCQTKISPPGRLVYKSEKYTIRRLSGAHHKMYCQCLCLFAKLFLDSKSLYFALDGFEFYVLYDTQTLIPLGFFSREKNSWDKYNLACILVFPPFQGLGLGQLLIGFSYQLSLSEGLIGSPEKPLSTYGHKSYLAYWTKTVAHAVLNWDERVVSILEISQITAIRPEDVEEALSSIGGLIEEGNKQYISLTQISDWAKNLSLKPMISPDNCYLNSDSTNNNINK